MQTLKIELEHCYGIRKLKSEFDFSKGRAFAIYAPNGAMKTSLAKTFGDLSLDAESKDRIFPARASVRNILDEQGGKLAKESVLVLQPYDEVFGHTEKTSTLLVNSTLRKEYEKLHVKIDSSKEVFLKNLKTQSGSKKDLEAEISATFTKSNDEFYKALIRVKDEVIAQKDAPFSTIRYDKIFDEKVLTFLNTKDFRVAIQEYIEKYNELLAASTYFKKGVFNYYNAATIAKSLADNGFFKAKHTVRLNAATQTEISTEAELEALIQKEKDAITKDQKLKTKFAEIEKQLEKNVTLREFHAYLSDTQDILPELANLDKFREEIWKSYFKAKIDLFNDLIGEYLAAQKRKEEIEQEAAKEHTQWEQVIEIFNSRFYVPFKLIAENKIAVILGQESLLTLGFVFEDGADSAPVEKTELLKVLSSGEKKALYVLNIIFEVQARIKAKQETLFIVDDIADSFDYKNKYAIIEYLREISDQQQFRLLILTHNFDFFRTITSRFVGYQNSLMAVKTDSAVTLEQASGIKNIFVNDWKKNFFTDAKKKIASIPFIRNIVEYTKGDQDPIYGKLTALLHWKAETSDITLADLDAIFKQVFQGNESTANGGKKIVAVLEDAVADCLAAGDGLNFENKVVLSIAIRLAAERFMIDKINDNVFAASLEHNQTALLFKKFRENFPTELSAIDALQRVIVMTPETIHLNSFMYEPIIDMSDKHLRQLFLDVKALP